jgi:orotidine-5'-phosphate decarboxylase
MNAQDRIIVALDFPNTAQALQMVNTLGDAVGFYKVGLQLFTAEGTSVVRELRGRGKKVFLDLKFHDIPNTVEGAVRSVAALGIDLLTIHASGGAAMMQAAVRAALAAEHPPTVLAVTVLTSMNAEDLRSINVAVEPRAQVLALARMAKAADCGGIVCSPEEAAEVRATLGQDMKIVVPGIRPAGSAIGDQSRIATPQQAIASGADYLVIGRPITAAADPQSAAEDIIRELSGHRSVVTKN